MGKGEYLGEFEIVVLLSIQRLGADAYGVRIRDEIRERGGRAVSLPTVYSALERLERKGYVSSQVGESTPERGGRAKRFFAVEPAGVVALNTSLELFRRLADEPTPAVEGSVE